MSRNALILFLVQEFITVVIIALGWHTGMSWWLIGALVAVLLECASVTRRGQATRRNTAFLWTMSFLAVAAALTFRRSVFFVEDAHGWAALLIAIALVLSGRRIRDEATRRHWKILETSWGLAAALVWLVTSYSTNRAGVFHASLVLGLVMLLVAKKRFQMGPLAIQIANTAVLLLVALPMVDFVIRPRYVLDTQPDTRMRHYSYEAARRDPVAFGRWWKYFVTQWSVLADRVYTADPAGALPFRLAPGSEGRFFQGRISINTLGFRGREIARPKGDCFRIVALGESTTFGCTLNAEDKTWPEWLEEMIRERLAPERPVEVINAGTPSFTLEHNLIRMAGEILPLEPDLLISYHGANGFQWLDSGLPPPVGRKPPHYRDRPLKLLADVEHRLRLLAYDRRHAGHPHSMGAAGNPLDTRYGRHYETLIQVARTNGIGLVLANYSMAVNARSDRDVIEFYRSGFPGVYRQIQANEQHSRLIEQLGERHPEITTVNTHTNLDGACEQFIDLVHFTEPGRRQLAEHIFAGLQPILERKFNIGSQPATVSVP